MGDRLAETCLDITAGLVDATYLPGRSQAKLGRLHQAGRDLTRARDLVRLICYSARCSRYVRKLSPSLHVFEPAGRNTPACFH